MEWLQLFPVWYQFLMVGVLGTIIGSFLNVYIYRFHTGKSLSGRSHCLSCGTPLKAFELVPLLSYLGLRGRCRTCGSFIPTRYFLVEACTGALFVLAFMMATSFAHIFYLWAVVSLLVVITVYDIRHYIIPDALTLALTFVSLVWLLYDAIFLGGALPEVLYTIVAAALGSGFLFSLWWISKGKWIGFGDVKLAFPLGLIVSAAQVFSMIVLSFWIGAGVSLLLIGMAKLQRGKLRLRFSASNLTMRSVVPFAPFLVAGCLVVLFTTFNVLTLFTF